ncbi:hypothetical protein EJ110_NYTH18225 [Nymphaea thermarum]|nr:hypothetical protein EJ110_NYTH18225 [Nymphaea thermarum]
MVKLVSKLHLARDKLREWSKQGPNDLVRIIERLRVQVGVAQNHLDRVDLSASSREIKLHLTLLKLIKMDEERLRQKARVRWMKEGNSNSKFFHAMAKGRQRRNHIRTIMDGQRVLSDMDEIFVSCTTYFKELLTDNAGSSTLPSNVCTGLTVIDEENELLVSPIRDEEIQWAVLRAKKESAAGPDGFNNRFYQSYWSIIGPDCPQHCSLTVRKDPGSSPQGGCGKETYLFIVTMEILNRNMLAYMQMGNIWGPKVSALSSIHSSFYADDVLVFIEGRKKFFLGLRNCFFELDACSGLKVNTNKTSVYFINLSDFECSRLCAITGWKRGVVCRSTNLCPYVPCMFLDSMSIPMHLSRLEDSRQDILEWVDRGSRPLSRHHISDLLRDSSPTQPWRNAIWNVGAPPRAAWTTYLGVEGRLQVDARAQKHGLYLASTCYICKSDQEDINHVFLHCKEARSLWELVIKKFRQSNFHPLMVGLPWEGWRWEHGTSHNIHIAVCLTVESRDVAALVRDSSGRYIFGIACWSDAARATDEAWVLQQSLLAVQESDRNAGNIKVICNNGFFISRCSKCFRNDSLKHILRGVASRLCNSLVFIKDDPASEVFHLFRRGDSATICKVWHQPSPDWRPYKDIL